ncbi:hypothetical protein [Bradyrhizobium elkanii]
MKKKAALPRVPEAELALAGRMVHAAFEAFLERKHRTNRDRLSALVTLKKVLSLLMHHQTLRGNQPGLRANLAVDRAVIADVDRHGSLLASVNAHIASGNLSNHIQPSSHYIRILGRKKAAKTKIKRRQ